MGNRLQIRVLLARMLTPLSKGVLTIEVYIKYRKLSGLQVVSLFVMYHVVVKSFDGGESNGTHEILYFFIEV